MNLKFSRIKEGGNFLLHKPSNLKSWQRISLTFIFCNQMFPRVSHIFIPQSFLNIFKAKTGSGSGEVFSTIVKRMKSVNPH